MLDCIIERKSSSDLVSSIADGRYEKQKALMIRSGLRMLTYVIEGNLDDIVNEPQRKAAKTASFQTEVWAGAVLQFVAASCCCRQQGYFFFACVAP